MSVKKRRARLSAFPPARNPAAVPTDGSARIDWVLLAILAFACAARLAVLVALRDHPLLQPRPGLDSAVYLDLARRVAGGDLLCGDRVFFVSPFYIYFAALVLAVSGGSVFAVQVTQALLGTAAVWFVARTARSWFGARGSWMAAAAAAATGYFAFQESLLLQSAVDPFLTAFGLWALARAWAAPRWPRFLLAGSALGLHVLNRPNMLAWAIAAVGLTALGAAGMSRRAATAKNDTDAVEAPRAGGDRPGQLSNASPLRLTAVAALVVGLLVPLAPVALRNFAVAREVALVSSHGGLNFYIGNNPRADGTYRPVAGITPSIDGQDRDMRRVAEQATGRPQTDVTASSWFLEQAVKWIEDRPGAAARLFAKKLAYVFNAADIPLNDSYAYYATDERSPLRFLIVGPWLLLPLGLAGVWFGRPAASSGAWWRWTAFVPVYAIGVAVFFVTGRYRLPILVACCVTAAGCLVALAEHARAGRWRQLGLLLGVVAVLGVGANLDLGLDNGLAAWRADMILHLIGTGQDASAEAMLARTEPMYPNRSLLLYRVGRAWLARGEAGRALATLQRAQVLAPGRKEVDLDIGEALLRLGRVPEAVEHLEAARDVPGREDEARVKLARAQAMGGHSAAALAELSAVRAPEALDATSQIVAGRLALELGQAGVAEPFLARAAVAAPGDPEIRESHGLALAMLGRRTEAITALEETCRLDPSNAGVRMNLAILYAEAGRIRSAREMAVEAIRIRPDDPRARQFLATLPPER